MAINSRIDGICQMYDKTILLDIADRSFLNLLHQFLYLCNAIFPMILLHISYLNSIKRN